MSHQKGSFTQRSIKKEIVTGKVQDDSSKSQHDTMPKSTPDGTKKRTDSAANVTPDDKSSLVSQESNVIDKSVTSKGQGRHEGSEGMICEDTGQDESFEHITHQEMAESQMECQKSPEHVEDSVSSNVTGDQVQLEQLKGQLHDKEKEIAGLNEAIVAKEQECSKLQEKNERLNGHLQNQEDEIAGLDKAFTAKQKELSKLQEETKEILSEKEKLQKIVENQEQEMNLACDERGQLEQRLQEQRQQTEALKQQVKTNMEGIKSYQQENKELKMEIESLSSRLAKEMNTKVSASEDSLENVSIKNRPMKVAEDFANFCTKEWQDMKQGIDNILSSDIEHYKLQLLTDILMIAHEKAQETIQQLHAVLQNPMILKRTKDTPPEPATKKNLPDALVSALGDFLKTSSEHSTNILQEAIKDELQKKCETQNEKDEHISAVWPLCNDFHQMKNYISGAASLAWNMAVQRPPMRFSVEGIGDKWLGDKKQDIYWGSDDPKDESAKVKCYAHPILYHGDSLMARGKVMVKKTNMTCV